MILNRYNHYLREMVYISNDRLLLDMSDKKIPAGYMKISELYDSNFFNNDDYNGLWINEIKEDRIYKK